MSQGFGGLTILSNAVGIKDGANLDAFSRLRVSDPTTLFSVQCEYDAAPLIMEGGATGTGVAPAHQTNSRMVKLSCTAGTGISFFQSYDYIPYQAGKSQLIAITGLLEAGVADTTVDVGYFDSANGIFLRQNGASGLQLIRRTSTNGSIVNNAVNKSAWSIDKLDGSGASGLTIDETKVFILIIDLQFLGMGRVRVGFDIGGQIVYVHEFNNANVIAVPYMQTANLPVQMLITATTSGSTKDAYFKCAAVASEGGLNYDLAYHFSTPEGTVSAGSGARTHILSVRPTTTFNSKTNRTRFILDSVQLMVTGSFPVYWELCIGQAISGTTAFTAVNATYSGVEYNTAGTISGSPTLVIESGYIANSAGSRTAVNQEIALRYPVTLDRAGAVRSLGTLSLIVSGIGGASATRAVMNFNEVRQ